VSQPHKNVTDSRAYQGQLERELIVGGLIVGAVVGIGLIYLIWGPTPALTSLLCFVGFLGVIALVWGFLRLVEWLGQRE
jgi:hypothetical protein